MKTFSKIIAGIALIATSVVVQAEVSGELGAKSSHVRRGSELGNEATYYGAMRFELAGLSFGATVVDTSNNGEHDYVCCNPGAFGNLTETTYDVGYAMSVGYLDLNVGYLQRENNWEDAVGETDTAELSVGIDLGGIDFTYVDGEVKGAAALALGEPSYTDRSLGYTVGNTRFLLGETKVTAVSAPPVGWTYYEITAGTEAFGLDLTATLTGVISIDDEFGAQAGVFGGDTKSSLVIGVSKSLSL